MEITLLKILMLNIGDKGVGREASKNLKAYNSNIGVASKDSSNVNLKRAIFLR